ncbi:MAG: DNA-processing protein DprA [Oscillospiraceae bacterium]|nr:DNA-processing protein DprA [Oscillospiraceae bacterium]
MKCPVEYWVWLSLAFGPGAKYDGALDKFGDPRSLYDSGEEGFLSIPKIRSDMAKRLSAVTLGDAYRVIEQVEKLGGKIITFESEEYPARLKNIYAFPIVLYVKGELPDIEENLCIGMVGTRKCSRYGINAAVKIGGELAANGAVIVSGLAEGIDSAAHSAAITAGGKTIAVMATGIDRVYPKFNKGLMEKIIENGAVITDYPPNTEVNGKNFPVRNRLIAGISSGVIMVEGSRRSGALITANHAIEQGKDVFAVPGNIFRENLEGNNALLKQGAIPVTCAEDVFNEYEYKYIEKIRMEKVKLEPRAVSSKKSEDTGSKSGAEQLFENKNTVKKELNDGASEEAKAVYEKIGNEPITAEDISAAVGLPFGTVAAALTELEIYGVIKSLPGNNFCIN